MQTTYDKFPEVTVQGYDDQAWQGWESIEATLNLRLQPPPEPYWLWTAIPASGLTNWSSVCCRH